MRLTRIAALSGVALLLAGCSIDSPVAPTRASLDASAASGSNASGNKLLTVASYNLYLGASLDPILGEPNAQLIPVRVAQVWAKVQQTNFPERAGRIAAQIAAAGAQVVGLQEVSLWRTRPFGSDPAGATVAYDFLDILLDSLSARGLSFDVASTSSNFDAELPSATGMFVRMTDRDAIIARRDVQTSDPRGALYAARLPFVIGGAVPIQIVRGWTSMVAQYRGERVRVLNTHLEVESGPFGAIQVLQGGELQQMIAAEPLPMVIVGDLNSAADGSSTPTYARLVAAGVRDAWSVAFPGTAGWTNGQAENLLNADSQFDKRIDYVLFRPSTTEGFEVRTADILGEEQRDRTASGLWPSDHAGVAATFRLVKTKFLP